MTLDRFSLTGNVAIVTGSGRGIGKAIALAALYLASPAASWVTGRLFPIDGGAEWSYHVMGAMVKDLL